MKKEPRVSEKIPRQQNTGMECGNRHHNIVV